MRSMRWIGACALAALAGLGGTEAAAAQPTVDGRNVSLAGARKVMQAAMEYARTHGAPGGAIAIVDAGGSLVLLERLDGTFSSASRISTGKARTAAEFKKPTKAFEDAVNGGRTSMTALPDFYPLQGGIPLTVRGQVVGAIGVSGAASADQDQEIALAGAAALAIETAAQTAAPDVRQFDDAVVRDAFARGVSLVDEPGFKVNPSRRDGPGEAEVHVLDTDIFYVLEGRATFVTGGRLIEGRESGDGEIRGSGIRDGEPREIGTGDVIVIPPGVPHWFREVTGPFTYYTVKVTGDRS